MLRRGIPVWIYRCFFCTYLRIFANCWTWSWEHVLLPIGTHGNIVFQPGLEYYVLVFSRTRMPPGCADGWNLSELEGWHSLTPPPPFFTAPHLALHVLFPVNTTPCTFSWTCRTCKHHPDFFSRPRPLDDLDLDLWALLAFPTFPTKLDMKTAENAQKFKLMKL